MINIKDYVLKLKIKIDFIEVFYFCLFSIVYLGFVGLLFARVFFKKEFDVFMGYFTVDNFQMLHDYIVVDSFQTLYNYLKQYLKLQELMRSMHESKVLHLEILNTELEIKRVQNEIKTLKDSSETLQKMLLPDMTETEVKMAERKAAVEKEKISCTYAFFGLVGASIVYEAVVLWFFW